jgi:glycerol-1-phosphate dehydrogenase [NAD(P)+]
MNESNSDNFKSRWMLLPRNVVVGNGVINDIGNVCNALKLNGNALIVSGPTTINRAGSTVAKVLEDNGCNVHSVIVDKPEMDEVEKVEQLILPNWHRKRQVTNLSAFLLRLHMTASYPQEHR